MRLLWMKSDYVLPPDTGGKIRTYNLLRELHQICDVTYLSFKDPGTPDAEAEIRTCASNVVTVCQPEEHKQGARFYGRVLRGMASSLPYTVQKYRSPTIVDHQRKFAGGKSNGDGGCVILCDFLEMAENIDWSLRCPKVLFQHNVESMIWDRYYQTETNPLKKAYFGFERQRMFRYERDACNRFDLIFTVSREDKDVLTNQLGVTRPIEVLETGVDANFFSPADRDQVVPSKLVFLGSMDWMPNIDGMTWFIDNVYSRIQAKRPEVTVDIVGRRPVPRVRQLEQKHSSIRVIADVPDVRPYIAGADLFVVPLRVGGGSRIKIYEAMAMNRPVVSTTIGAEGLPLTAGNHIAIADSPAEFAQQVIELLEQPARKESISSAGHRLVTQNYQWKNVARSLKEHCLELEASYE